MEDILSLENICNELYTSKNKQGLFCELDTLLGKKKKKHPSESNMLPFHEFQIDTPLMVFTKFKIHGLGVLGEGLLFQQELFRAMARQIKVVRDQLLDKDNTIWNSLASKKDVQTSKVAFLDLQGSEKVGTLIFCRNYSVAFAYIGALRNLVFRDVFNSKSNSELWLSINRSELHRLILKHSRKDISDSMDGLLDEHAFQWTVSSLSVSAKSFIEIDYKYCNGFVSGQAKIKVPPGHLVDFKKGSSPKKLVEISLRRLVLPLG